DICLAFEEYILHKHDPAHVRYRDPMTQNVGPRSGQRLEKGFATVAHLVNPALAPPDVGLHVDEQRRFERRVPVGNPFERDPLYKAALWNRHRFGFALQECKSGSTAQQLKGLPS